MSNSQIDQLYMRRALELAELGRGSVSPNPMVGCVIVHENRIIGEGWHKRYGENHAERNAIQNVVFSDLSLLSESTVYVTLEPCTHVGKQPPCADLLIEKRPRKIVVCNIDPNPLVAGRGLKKLQDADIEVVVGVLESEGQELNRRFFTYIAKHRPYVILKWAETADGFIGNEDSSPLKISNELSHTMSHRWRSEEDAIMVGTNTALTDDPKLSVRNWSGRNPVRIVIDQHLRLPQSLCLFDGSQNTICYYSDKMALPIQNRQNLNFVNIDFDESFLQNLLSDLYARQIQSLLVEGGAKLLQSFINQNLWDEVRVFKSLRAIRKGISAPILPTNTRLKSTQDLMGDTLQIYSND
jgi:diaminohydroxyphosphoribosylaminopyrimidine deaminase / 5-amino-6-(5-phosphoribosylamino)uracil reductase